MAHQIFFWRKNKISINKKNKSDVLYIHGGGDVIGGVETYLTTLMLNHRNYVPHLLLLREGLYYEYLKKRGVANLEYIRGGRYRELLKNINALYLAKKYISQNKIDLIVAHGLHSWLFCWILSRITGIKNILFLHGPLDQKVKNTFFGKFALYFRPNYYLANSEFTSSVSKENVSVDIPVVYPTSIVNDYNAEEIKMIKSKIRDEYNIPIESTVFCVVSRIQMNKGQDIAIKAFNKLKKKENIFLLVVGDCTFDSDKTFMDKLIRITGNDKRIIFTGYREDVPELLTAIDVLIQPSVYPEPFGLTITEGMYAGKVVIASSHGGPAEIIENGVDGYLFEPGNDKELSEIMDFTLNNQNKNLVKNAREKIEKKFNVENSVSHLELQYSHIV